MEQTLVLLKPDCVARRLVGTVLARFEQKGLRIAALKLIQVDQPLAEQHYSDHKEKPFFGSLIEFLTSGATVAVILEGQSAITVVRGMMGKTNGAESPPGTIRGDYALSIQNNLIHGSDSAESAKKEIALWFKSEEMTAYELPDKQWIG